VRCPKDLNVTLTEGLIADGLLGHSCPSCQGSWIPAETYQAWQQMHSNADVKLDELPLPSSLAVDYRPSPYDSRAGLCPECGHYLVRGRVNLQASSFFVERCPACQGIWCDRDEWAVLETLGLEGYIPLVFTDEWQGHVRVLEAELRERQATIDKLGPEVAAKVFELADLLERHPYGDFGVAYLMRRFEA
jgi:Zn-finger nucleic acid-binding protein